MKLSRIIYPWKLKNIYYGNNNEINNALITKVNDGQL